MQPSAPATAPAMSRVAKAVSSRFSEPKDQAIATAILELAASYAQTLLALGNRQPYDAAVPLALYHAQQQAKK